MHSRFAFSLMAVVGALACSSSDDGDAASGGAGGVGAGSGTGASSGTGGTSASGGTAGSSGVPGGGGTGATGGTTSICTECSCLNGATATLSADVQPIFDQRCASATCHGGAAPKAQLNLTAGSSHGQLVGVATNQCSGSKVRVTAGDPGASYLVNKLTGIGMCFGTAMPKSTTKLTQAQLESIVAWICAGAQND